MSVTVDRREDGIAVVVLDDPDHRNAMSEDMGLAMRDTFRDLMVDADLRVAVLTGAPPAFSAGGDLAMLEDLSRRGREEDHDATRHMREFYDAFLTVRDLPVPVIAAVNGHAIGAGLCVALACDLRIVAEDARVGLNFAKLGLHPGMAGSWLLPRAIGDQRAAAWLYTGRLVSGAEAAEAGLALAALASGDVLPAALELAEEIASASPMVVRQLKVSLAHSPTASLAEQLDREASAQAVNYGTDDLREGLQAVRERRSPTFTGR